MNLVWTMLTNGQPPERVTELEALVYAPPDAERAASQALVAATGTFEVPANEGVPSDARVAPNGEPLVKPAWWVDDITAAQRENALVGRLENESG